MSSAKAAVMLTNCELPLNDAPSKAPQHAEKQSASGHGCSGNHTQREGGQRLQVRMLKGLFRPSLIQGGLGIRHLGDVAS